LISPIIRESIRCANSVTRRARSAIGVTRKWSIAAAVALFSKIHGDPAAGGGSGWVAWSFDFPTAGAVTTGNFVTVTIRGLLTP
jgi:hypothetical protein